MAQAGRFNERIDIEVETVTGRATNGEDIFSWTPLVSNVAASRKDLAGREYLEAKQTTADIDTVWEIYWRNDILPTMRINHEGQYYRIQSPPSEVGSRHDRLQIMSKRFVPDA